MAKAHASTEVIEVPFGRGNGKTINYRVHFYADDTCVDVALYVDNLVTEPLTHNISRHYFVLLDPIQNEDEGEDAGEDAGDDSADEEAVVPNSNIANAAQYQFIQRPNHTRRTKGRSPTKRLAPVAGPTAPKRARGKQSDLCATPRARCEARVHTDNAKILPGVSLVAVCVLSEILSGRFHAERGPSLACCVPLGRGKILRHLVRRSKTPSKCPADARCDRCWGPPYVPTPKGHPWESLLPVGGQCAFVTGWSPLRLLGSPRTRTSHRSHTGAGHCWATYTLAKRTNNEQSSALLSVAHCVLDADAGAA